MIEWRYLPDGKRTHAFTGTPYAFAVALCGAPPVWFNARGWFGTGTQDEYERVEQLPKCKRCVKALTRRGVAT